MIPLDINALGSEITRPRVFLESLSQQNRSGEPASIAFEIIKLIADNLLLLVMVSVK